MLAPGVVLDSRYQIIRTLSNKGGTAVVYEATHLQLGRTVAVKETKHQQFEAEVRDIVLKAFQREATLLANLAHPALPRVYDSFSAADGHFLVMDFIPGPDLDEMLKARPAAGGAAFSTEEVVNWAIRLLSALEYMHGHDEPIIHRDIKPANLKLTDRSEIVLLDFGLAKGAVVGMQSVTTIHGYTKQYAPLEQINGETADCRSDLFSFGATLYQLLTGELPPDAIKRVTSRNEGKPDPLKPITDLNPAVPPKLAAVIHRALALYPQERPATAAEIAAELSGGKAVTISPPIPAAAVFEEDTITIAKAKAFPPPSPVLMEADAGPVAVDAYQWPPVELLTPPAPRAEWPESALRDFAQALVGTLMELGVAGQVLGVNSGAVVTMFEFKPDPGVKYSQVTALADALQSRLKTGLIRMDRIPSRSAIGIEIPNGKREILRLRELLEPPRLRQSESKLMLALGQTVEGENFLADPAGMPHLLIAGASGAGKAVALRSILLSLLFQASPREAKLLLIDLKNGGFEVFAGLPHLVMPPVMKAGTARRALEWVFSEMERRYQLMADVGVRNIEQYNAEVRNRLARGDAEAFRPLPRVIIVVNEPAEPLTGAALGAEERVARLMRMSPAAGIHLILSSTWPPPEGLAELMRATFPARICLRTVSKADSYAVLESAGAEGLLGQGDMLFCGPNTKRPIRLQGGFVDETEVERVCGFIKSQTTAAGINVPKPAAERALSFFKNVSRRIDLSGDKKKEHAAPPRELSHQGHSQSHSSSALAEASAGDAVSARMAQEQSYETRRLEPLIPRRSLRRKRKHPAGYAELPSNPAVPSANVPGVILSYSIAALTTLMLFVILLFSGC